MILHIRIGRSRITLQHGMSTHQVAQLGHLVAKPVERMGKLTWEMPPWWHLLSAVAALGGRIE